MVDSVLRQRATIQLECTTKGTQALLCDSTLEGTVLYPQSSPGSHTAEILQMTVMTDFWQKEQRCLSDILEAAGNVNSTARASLNIPASHNYWFSSIFNYSLERQTITSTPTGSE